MKNSTRSSLIFGIIFILIGAWFLAVQLVPGLDWFWRIITWPVIVIIVGVFLLVLGLILRAPGMAIPASIVSGIGGMLYWMNATGNWESWAYSWPLVPCFVGVGLMLMSILGEGGRNTFRVGAWMSIISLIVFALFGAFFGARVLGTYWPILLIIFGLWVLVQPLFRRKAAPVSEKIEPIEKVEPAEIADSMEADTVEANTDEGIKSIEPEDIGEDL